MEHHSIIACIVLLIFLFCVAVFFSAAETSMMSLNRYRLRHLVRKKNRAAMRVDQLLEYPDRLLGVVLIGNTVANIVASAVMTYLAVHLWSQFGIAMATVFLTCMILIFGEIMPKTIAATHPQRTAFHLSLVLSWILTLLYPLVWLANSVVNAILKLLRVPFKKVSLEHLSSEELSTVVSEAAKSIPAIHQDMLLAILSLENVTVNDIMLTRQHIIGIDLEDNWQTIYKAIINTRYSRLPIYKGDINHVKGILDIRNALSLLKQERFTKQSLVALGETPYFVPEHTPLHTLLRNFRVFKVRMGLVVDEYGEIIGLVTMEDILDEIMGKFSTGVGVGRIAGVKVESDGSYLVNTSVNLRDLNRAINAEFPTTGPKTLGGLIMEYLETIPDANVCMELANLRMEIISIKENRISEVRIWK